MTSSDKCQHCDARCTLDHMFWECPHNHDLRASFTCQKDEYVAKVKRHSPSRARAIEARFHNPCFRNCGICGLDSKVMEYANKLCDDVDPTLRGV